MLPAKCRFLQQTAGFTLVELLLALVMFATIAGVIFASFAAVADGVDKGRQSAEMFRIGRGALQRLTQEIEGALWYEDDTNTRWIGEDDTTDGQPRDRLTFVTIPYRSFGSTPEGELCDVSYFIAENVQGHTALFRTEDCTLDSERQEEEDAPRLELTDLAVGLDVTYYDAEGAHDEWPPGRQDNAPLPCRVRVALTLRDPQEYERVFITTVPVFMRGTCEETSQ
jgi:type II secretion system protein J